MAKSVEVKYELIMTENTYNYQTKALFRKQRTKYVYILLYIPTDKLYNRNSFADIEKLTWYEISQRIWI